MRSCSEAGRPSGGARSISTTNARARPTWRRNLWPSPVPPLAPPISPGLSAPTLAVRILPPCPPGTFPPRALASRAVLLPARAVAAAARLAVRGVAEGQEGGHVGIGHQPHVAAAAAVAAVRPAFGDVRL